MAKYNRFGLTLPFGVLVALVVGLPVTAGVTQRGEDGTHIEQLDAAIRQNPNDARLFLERGKVYFQHHNYDNAINDFGRALKLDKHTDEAHFWLGMALGRQGKIREGIEQLSVYIQRRPNESRAFTKRGVRYLWLGELDNAERDLRKAIELDDTNAEAHDDLGVILARRGDTAKAMNHFKTTITLDPTYQKGFHNLAMTYFLVNSFESALYTVDQGLRLDPENKNSLLLKSAILEALGRHEEAQSVASHAEFLPDGNWSELLDVE